MASTFKALPAFDTAMRVLRQGIEDAAEEAMGQAMAQAEKDTQSLYRWRKPGTYTETDRAGNTWTWEVTGQTAASITGYVVGNKRLKNLNPGPTTTVTRNGMGFAPRTHGVDASLTGDYSERDGHVMGIVTMYTAYAPYLQAREKRGGEWGTPTAGEPVTIEVLRVNWDAYYVPNIIRPTIERVMQRIAARLR